MPPNFFSKILASSVTRSYGQLSSFIISEKTNDSVLKKYSDGWTDRRRDRQLDESDFLGCCPTNVKRPIIVFLRLISAKITNCVFMWTQYRRLSELCQTATMELCAKMFNRFYFHSILDIYQSSEYASAITAQAIPKFKRKVVNGSF